MARAAVSTLSALLTTLTAATLAAVSALTALLMAVVSAVLAAFTQALPLYCNICPDVALVTVTSVRSFNGPGLARVL